MSNTRRILVYIIPVTALSFALNIPKFMEVTITETNGTNAVDPSQTRSREGLNANKKGFLDIKMHTRIYIYVYICICVWCEYPYIGFIQLGGKALPI